MPNLVGCSCGRVCGGGCCLVPNLVGCSCGKVSGGGCCLVPNIVGYFVFFCVMFTLCSDMNCCVSLWLVALFPLPNNIFV